MGQTENPVVPVSREKEVNPMNHRSKYDVMEEILHGISGLMEDLVQSGFDTVHDGTLEELHRAAQTTEQYGMARLSELLSGLFEQASAGRHQMEKNTSHMAQLYTQVTEYLYLSQQKTAYDRGLAYYSNTYTEDIEETDNL